MDTAKTKLLNWISNSTDMSLFNFPDTFVYFLFVCKNKNLFLSSLAVFNIHSWAHEANNIITHRKIYKKSEWESSAKINGKSLIFWIYFQVFWDHSNWESTNFWDFLEVQFSCRFSWFSDCVCLLSIDDGNKLVNGIRTLKVFTDRNVLLAIKARPSKITRRERDFPIFIAVLLFLVYTTRGEKRRESAKLVEK